MRPWEVRLPGEASAERPLKVECGAQRRLGTADLDEPAWV